MKKITYLLVMLAAGSAAAQEDCNLQYDGNGDGAVNVEDVLGVLSEFGEVCEPAIEQGPCGGDSTIAYYGYDYGLVEIGEQCWFAENLRAEHYANGDAIPAELTADEWNNTTEGAQAVYNNDASNLAAYGRLYNWYAVADARSLCPTGWHVPTDGEFMTLEMELGMSESDANTSWWRGTDQGTQMKATYGWHSGGNGTNSSGFSGLPGGYRLTLGSFSNAGLDGRWWSSSTRTATSSWSRSLNFDLSGVHRAHADLRYGFSVRCIKD